MDLRRTLQPRLSYPPLKHLTSVEALTSCALSLHLPFLFFFFARRSRPNTFVRFISRPSSSLFTYLNGPAQSRSALLGLVALWNEHSEIVVFRWPSHAVNEKVYGHVHALEGLMNCGFPVDHVLTLGTSSCASVGAPTSRRENLIFLGSWQRCTLVISDGCLALCIWHFETSFMESANAAESIVRVAVVFCFCSRFRHGLLEHFLQACASGNGGYDTN
ncbi:hypothetical protein GQ44DRAFT_394383 [Phaeosphaeriaceae sp. PMI808]|nr:hypothetical protein GQ44DRAFT_394383 [Phaeosphaeriaceae sp. PMI808]